MDPISKLSVPAKADAMAHEDTGHVPVLEFTNAQLASKISELTHQVNTLTKKIGTLEAELAGLRDMYGMHVHALSLGYISAKTIQEGHDPDLLLVFTNGSPSDSRTSGPLK